MVAHVNFVLFFVTFVFSVFIFFLVYLRVATQFKLSMKETNQRTSSGWVLEERKIMIRYVFHYLELYLVSEGLYLYQEALGFRTCLFVCWIRPSTG